MAIVKELFGAYQKGELPQDGGYIISSFFDGSSTYTKYEVTSYNNVKDIYVNEDGLVFQADGWKIFVLVEPANYSNKHVEPAYRDASHMIPYRQKEVDVYTSKRQDKVMVGREPIVTYTSFTVLKSAGNNFSYIVFKTDDILQAIQTFFATSLWKDARVPKTDADKTAKEILVAFKKIMIVE
ncbi:MAG: transposase [Spirochaetaceae bacterium]|nr:MAG: transposase [Spirochaetaceae bacterium]